MEGEKKPNRILRRERQLRGWTQQRVASVIGTSEDVVSRWERGERKPSPFFQEQLCVLYGKTAEELGFLEPTRLPSSPLLTQAREGDHALQERLDQAESIVNLAWEAWFGSRPKQVTREISKLLPTLERMLSLPAATVCILRLKELVIRCHGLLGTIYQDGLHNDAALYHYLQAHKVAEDIHDTNLAVTYLALMGDVLRQRHDKATALRYLEQARERAVHAERATAGHVLQLLAYTYGDMGEELAFERTIAAATDLLAFAGEGRDTVKKEFIPFEVYEIRGKATRDLGKPLHALPSLDLAEQSLDKTDAVTPRWHALLSISRGQAYCDGGDLSTGLALLSKGFTLAYQCRSPHQMNRVRKMVRKLGESPDRNHPQLQQVKDLLYETYLRMDTDAF